MTRTTPTDPIPDDLQNDQARRVAQEVADVRYARARAKAAETTETLLGVCMVGMSMIVLLGTVLGFVATVRFLW